MSKGVNNTRKVNKQAEYIAGVRKYYNIFSSKWPTYYNKKEKRIKPYFRVTNKWYPSYLEECMKEIQLNDIKTKLDLVIFEKLPKTLRIKDRIETYLTNDAYREKEYSEKQIEIIRKAYTRVISKDEQLTYCRILATAAAFLKIHKSFEYLWKENNKIPFKTSEMILILFIVKNKIWREKREKERIIFENPGDFCPACKKPEEKIVFDISLEEYENIDF